VQTTRTREKAEIKRLPFLDKTIDSLHRNIWRSRQFLDRVRGDVDWRPVFQPTQKGPYETYQQLRDLNSLYRHPWMGYVVARYEDADRVLNSNDFSARAESLSSRRRVATRVFNRLVGLPGALPNMPDDLLGSDHSAHYRLQKLFAPTFKRESIQSHRPWLERRADELLQPLRHGKQLDIITDFAEPLAFEATARVVGFDTFERSQWNLQWSSDGLLMYCLPTPTTVRRMHAALGHIREFVESALANRSTTPRNDLLSLIAENLTKDGQSDPRAFTLSIVMVAQDVTKFAIGNCVMALLQHPKELNHLIQKPGQLRPAIAELLRYESPVQFVTRTPIRPVVIRGVPLQPGDRVVVGIGSANRDPSHFNRPDCLDLMRQEASHFSFGKGIHYCLGASLSQLIIEVALCSLLELLPRMHYASHELQWYSFSPFRGLRSFPVTVSAN